MTIPGDNSYPNPDNYPAPSFRRPIPLPDVPPDEGNLIYVAYNPAWIPALMGAVEQLMLPSTWQGDHEDIINALNEASVLQWLLTEPNGGDVPAPYWDDAEDSDDELPPLEQVWYGIFDGTFQETMENWLIAGFIAYSGQPGAAITFLTLAPKFRLAWKKGDIGGLIRVFIDGADAGTVDTYSDTPDVVYQDYVGDPEEEQHQILMFLEEPAPEFAAQADVESAMMVIRKRLDPNEGQPPDTRYDEETDTVETSIDGEIWTPNPGADPRTNPAYQLPPLTSNVRCAAAEGMRQQIGQWVLAVVGATSVTGLANITLGISIILIPISWMWTLFLGVAGAALTIGSVTIGNAFTPEVLEEIKCILYCNLDANGRLSATSLQNARDQVASQIGDAVVTACFDLMIQSWGYVGFNNAGVLKGDPEAECDCVECEWCVFFDFTVDDWGFTPISANNTVTTYANGAGWQGIQTIVQAGVSVIASAQISFASTMITEIQTIGRSNGIVSPEQTTSGSVNGSIGGSPFHFTTVNVGNNVDVVDTWSPMINMTTINLRAQNNASSGVTIAHGIAVIRSVRIRGIGANPFDPDALC